MRTPAPASLVLSLLATCLFSVPGACQDDRGGQEQAEASETTEAAAPAPEATTRVLMKTSRGDMTLELYVDKAPITVGNFLAYARDGFYEGTVFHRVIKGFMAQGGGVTADYQQKPTRAQIPNEADNGLKNERLTLAMARQGGAHTASSQFFINDDDNTFLDHVSTQDDRSWGYCVFGKVVEGIETYQKIINAKVSKDPRADRNKPAAPVEPITIDAVVILDPEAAGEIIAAGEALAEMWPVQAGIDLVASKGVDVSQGQISDSGLWSLDVVEGQGRNPGPTEKVTVHYTGWLVDGSQFDSSHDRGQPATFGLNQVIRGWTEGVGSMKAGGKRYLVIPYQLAYGKAGRPGIPPSATLVFEIELLSIGG